MISVITCTYNRCNSLINVYLSLKNQSNKNFKWIIYDDGSTDKTESQVHMWEKEETKFVICYRRSDVNRGFTYAWNSAVQMVDTEYMMFCDSNKTLTPDAIEKGYELLKTVEGNVKFAGIAGLRMLTNGEICGGTPKFRKKRYIDASNLKRYKFALGGDKAEIYKTDLVKKHFLPQFENERFATEACCFDAIASDGYILRWFPIVLCIGNYEADGLTQNNMNGVEGYIQNYKGYSYFVRQAVGLYDLIPRCNLLLTFDKVEKHKKHTIQDSAIVLDISVKKLKTLYVEADIYNFIKIIYTYIRRPAMKSQP